MKLKSELRKLHADFGSELIGLCHNTNKEQINLFLAGVAGAHTQLKKYIQNNMQGMNNSRQDAYSIVLYVIPAFILRDNTQRTDRVTFKFYKCVGLHSATVTVVTLRG